MQSVSTGEAMVVIRIDKVLVNLDSNRLDRDREPMDVNSYLSEMLWGESDGLVINHTARCDRYRPDTDRGPFDSIFAKSS